MSINGNIMANRKNIIAIVTMFIIAFLSATTMQAQRSTNWVAYNGDHCWLIEARGGVTFDKEPISGDSKIESNAFARLTFFHHGLYAYAEGGYARKDFAGYVGGGVKLAKKHWFAQPAVELGLGLGSQYCGYNYKAATTIDNATGKYSVAISQDYLDSKLKFQARLAVNVEFRVAERVSVVAYGEGIYRPYEAKTLSPNGDFVINGVQIDAKSVSSIGLQSNKFVLGAGIGVKLAF